ncbi:MAG: alpha/beta fold hydrolase [Rubripirellula sp.]|nr:alpha/beta fold hydrolase [Rubripirellula sp.]
MARSSYRVRFTGGSGHELAGIIDRPDDRFDAPALVFSHCFTCSKDLKAIARISRGLAETGIAVLRYDMTGLGNSRGKFSQTNFSTNLADLTTAVEHARTHFEGSISLLGHSFGGAVSMAYAGSPLGQPQVSALITLAAPSDTQHLASLLAKMDPAIETTGSGTVTIGGMPWQIQRQMLDDFRRQELTAMIPKIRAATLLLHSPVDETLSYDHALRIMGLIQQSPETEAPVSLVTLPGSDHLLATNPADIDFVVEIVAAFIKRHRT